MARRRKMTRREDDKEGGWMASRGTLAEPAEAKESKEKELDPATHAQDDGEGDRTARRRKMTRREDDKKGGWMASRGTLAEPAEAKESKEKELDPATHAQDDGEGDRTARRRKMTRREDDKKGGWMASRGTLAEPAEAKESKEKELDPATHAQDDKKGRQCSALHRVVAPPPLSLKREGRESPILHSRIMLYTLRRQKNKKKKAVKMR